jgi:two-component system, LytTR family, response regulator
MRCIAIDDEPLALRKVCDYIARIPYLEQAGCFLRPLDAIGFLHQHKVDLIFLDIQMDLLTGIQFLELLDTRPFVIITTAYPQFALKGYDLDVNDYLLKPFTFDRFLKAVERVGKRFCKRDMPVPANEVTLPKESCLFVKSGRVIERIDPCDILFVEGMSEYLAIHLPQRKILTLMSFARLEQRLPPDQFIRIHKSYLVRIDRIGAASRHSVKISELELPVGGKYRENLMKRITYNTHRNIP